MKFESLNPKILNPKPYTLNPKPMKAHMAYPAGLRDADSCSHWGNIEVIILGL